MTHEQLRETLEDIAEMNTQELTMLLDETIPDMTLEVKAKSYILKAIELALITINEAHSQKEVLVRVANMQAYLLPKYRESIATSAAPAEEKAPVIAAIDKRLNRDELIEGAEIAYSELREGEL